MENVEVFFWFNKRNIEFFGDFFLLSKAKYKENIVGVS